MSTPAAAPLNIHASAVVVGETGLLILGEAGSGKSALARALIAAADARGWFARLIADDRVLLEARHGRLLARPHPAIAGLVERRWLGLARAPHEPVATLHFAIELASCGDLPRLPEKDASLSEFAGVALPLIRLPRSRSAADLALDALETCLSARTS